MCVDDFVVCGLVLLDIRTFPRYTRKSICFRCMGIGYHNVVLCMETVSQKLKMALIIALIAGLLWHAGHEAWVVGFLVFCVLCIENK